MLQALIVTLREGIEAALIVGITLAYLTKIGRLDLRKTVYAGLIAAFVGSVAGALVLSRLGLNSDAFEGWVELVAAFFVTGMVIFMARAARKLKGEIESKIGSLASGGSRWGVFAFVFLMVFREGVETVLILSGVSLNSTELMSFIGTLLGVALAVVFGVMFVKGSVRINLQKFFRVTSVILFFVAFQLAITGLHDLSEAGILPPSKREMALVGPIVRNDAFFFVAILALTGLMVLLEYRRQRPEAAMAASKAEERKSHWLARRERLWAVTLCLTTLVFILAITVEFVYAKSTEVLSKADAVTFDSNGQAQIAVADLETGDLHRYSVNINGTEVRFLLFRKSADKVEAVFDACQICGSMGFYKTSHGIACKNCASPINPESVGQPGGCNPIPLKLIREDKDSQGKVSAVTVAGDDLSKQVGVFTR
ncbi:MAG TPA: Fe-S-containing protein [Candidatus Angelobacter sp.]|jgi:FTR1 family protein|nr:Fe-S-containing protein [Candidatus Angelobacter sp.]